MTSLATLTPLEKALTALILLVNLAAGIALTVRSDAGRLLAPEPERTAEDDRAPAASEPLNLPLLRAAEATTRPGAEIG